MCFRQILGGAHGVTVTTVGNVYRAYSTLIPTGDPAQKTEFISRSGRADCMRRSVENTIAHPGEIAAVQLRWDGAPDDCASHQLSEVGLGYI